MYNNQSKTPTSTSIRVNQSYVGETLEQKINRIVNNKEPITDGAPLIYTERKDGVLPQYDIRTDRFEIAVEAMSKVDKSHKAAREERIKGLGEKAKENMEKEQKTETGGQSTQGTGGTEGKK